MKPMQESEKKNAEQTLSFHIKLHFHKAIIDTDLVLTLWWSVILIIAQATWEHTLYLHTMMEQP